MTSAVLTRSSFLAALGAACFTFIGCHVVSQVRLIGHHECRGGDSGDCLAGPIPTTNRCLNAAPAIQVDPAAPREEERPSKTFLPPLPGRVSGLELPRQTEPVPRAIIWRDVRSGLRKMHSDETPTQPTARRQSGAMQPISPQSAPTAPPSTFTQTARFDAADDELEPWPHSPQHRPRANAGPKLATPQRLAPSDRSVNIVRNLPPVVPVTPEQRRPIKLHIQPRPHVPTVSRATPLWRTATGRQFVIRNFD